MEKSEYEVIFNVEDTHWWYVGLRKLVYHYLEKFRPTDNSIRLLDAGCGTGGFLGKSTKYDSYGFDISDEAIRFCKIRNLTKIAKASALSIPFRTNTFHSIISLDVLYHKGVENDESALREYSRILKRRGLLIINLPAYDFLTSSHDRLIQTRHRYTRRELKQKIEGAGLKIEKITYRNTFLFPVIFLMRILKSFRRESRSDMTSDLKLPSTPINRILTAVLSLEFILLRFLNFPFGLSVFCVARKTQD